MIRVKGIAVSIVLILGVGFGLLASHVGAQADPAEEPIVREELDKRPLGTAEGKQARVVRVTLAPGAAFAEEPTVTYPAEEFVYVVDGTGILMRAGEEVQVAAGDVVYNARGEPHSLANVSTTEPLTVVAVWIGDEGDF